MQKYVKIGRGNIFKVSLDGLKDHSIGSEEGLPFAARARGEIT